MLEVMDKFAKEMGDPPVRDLRKTDPNPAKVPGKSNNPNGRKPGPKKLFGFSYERKNWLFTRGEMGSTWVRKDWHTFYETEKQRDQALEAAIKQDVTRKFYRNFQIENRARKPGKS